MFIFVEKLEFIGSHGFYEVERREGRRFQVDLKVHLGELLAVRDDKLEHTLDYRSLAEIIVAVGTGESYKLVERMGDEILTRVFDQHSAVLSADLTIRKFATEVPGDPECVGIQMQRKRPTI
ncbi:dihydroneopterin aldolase [Bradymonas sediminis]|nr:dihydroneopterin aldolase [Bradymonas sediminis]